jgi:hypothetical protein
MEVWIGAENPLSISIALPSISCPLSPHLSADIRGEL